MSEIVFVPHEAVYELELAEAPQSGLGLTGAAGVMKYKMEKGCEGWLSATSFALKLIYEGLGKETKFWNVSSFESFDGLAMSFASQIFGSEDNGEKFKGKAVLPAKGVEGRADFDFPEKISVPLPTGTMFPTAFNREMLQTARNGKKNLHAIVFDGSGFDALADVNAFISPSSQRAPSDISGDKNLLLQPLYKVTMAFFPYLENKEASSTPSYEIRSIYLENGIALEIIQDFGSFKVRAKLKKITALPLPNC